MGLPEFLNDALGQCGYARITGIDDGTPNANWCKTFYPALRQAALSTTRWGFAETRATLAQVATVPLFEFAYAYALPVNLLVIREFNGVPISSPTLSIPWDGWWYVFEGRYKVEGDQLYTNESEAKIVYTRDEENTAKWSALFYQMLSTWLASKLASAIGKDSAKSQSLYQQAIAFGLPLAAAVDSQQGTQVPYVADQLTRGR